MVKNQPANAGDVGSIPGLGKFPGEGYGNPFQYFCPGNPMDRGDWRESMESEESDITLWLKNKRNHGRSSQ